MAEIQMESNEVNAMLDPLQEFGTKEDGKIPPLLGLQQKEH